MSKQNIFYLAPDLGNSRTKVITLEGKLVSFPALLAPGRLQRYQYSFGLSSNNQRNEQSHLDLILQDGDGLFFVGDLAYDNADPARIKLSHDQEQSLYIKQKMLQVAMGLTLPTECQVQLVLSHPYSESHIAPAMAEMARGIRSYTLNGQDFCQQVVEVEMISQPVAGFRGVIADLSGRPQAQYADILDRPCVVMDIGGGTWDVCWIEFNQRSGQFEVKDQYSGSDRYGVWYALSLIQEAIYIKYRVKLHLVDLEYELQGDQTMVNIDGQLVDVSSIKDAAFAQAAADGLTYTTNLIPASVRRRIGRVFALGGGSVRFAPYLAKQGKHLFGDRFEFAPADAVVCGQHSKAVSLWGGQNGEVA